MDTKLETFDAAYGEAMLNALAVYAERMRETAAEAQGGANAPELAGLQDQDERDLREWSTEDLRVLARAAGMLWHSVNRADPLEVLSERQLALLDRAADGYLPPPEQPAENSAQTISVRPTRGGFARMAGLFTEAAAKADKARQAYEELTERS
jgi:hypothetical protein